MYYSFKPHDNKGASPKYPQWFGLGASRPFLKYNGCTVMLVTSKPNRTTSWKSGCSQ